MPGFLGGSSSSGGTGGEIRFPAEFVDPVTKLRVSEPQTLMDTDFEYGLQPTKWETVELINNTPSFFSASGDTTIANLVDMVTTAGSREIKVTTSLAHGLAVGIPLNISGTKSLTADGSYIINSVPDATTFTYLCKQNQLVTASIVDLYTSVITGQFFQGSQIKISDSEGIVTDAQGQSTITLKTDSPHGFGLNTPFYFLNLNSTISQEFDSSNTGAKTFDSSNTATAQSFDGSNTLTTYPIDLSNGAFSGGTASNVASVNTTSDTITVTHGAENFAGLKLGQPLYHSITASAGYFATTPRGIVYLASNSALGTSSSEFQVSATPGGTPIDLTVTLTGSFRIANLARTFAGNNQDTQSQTTLALVNENAFNFDGANNQGSTSTVNSFSNGSAIIQMVNDAGSTVSTGLSVGSMVRFTSTGTAAGGLANNTTYWITFLSVVVPSAPGLVQVKVSATPGGADIVISSQGSGTQKFQQIGVSLDKEWIHIPNHNFVIGDMVRYTFPVGGRFTTTESIPANFYFVEQVNGNNIQIGLVKGGLKDGSSAQRAAESAAAIKAATGTNTNGWYWIKTPDYSTAQQVYCIMDSAVGGGGWMLAMNLIANSNSGLPSGTPIWGNSFYSTQDGSINANNISLDNNIKTHLWGYFNPSQVLFVLHNVSSTSWRGWGQYTLTGGNAGARSLWSWTTQNTANQTVTSGRTAQSGDSGIPNTSCRPQTRGGDLFIDARNSGDSLHFRGNYGVGQWFGADGYNRFHIGTTMGSGNNSYGHTFGGIGGEHQNGGWNNGFKMAPCSPYCDCPGYYGEGNGSGNGNNYTNQGQNQISTTCGQTSTSCNRVSGSNIIDVGYAILVK
jgi:hypothetical protein